MNAAVIEWAQTNYIPVANKVSEDGFKVIASFNSNTPPKDISTVHNQIISCVQHEVDISGALAKSLVTYAEPAIDNGYVYDIPS